MRPLLVMVIIIELVMAIIIETVFLCQPTGGKLGPTRVCPKAGPHSKNPLAYRRNGLFDPLAYRRNGLLDPLAYRRDGLRDPLAYRRNGLFEAWLIAVYAGKSWPLPLPLPFSRFALAYACPRAWRAADASGICPGSGRGRSLG